MNVRTTVPALCFVILLAGCAGNPGPTSTQPVNGQCGIRQDTCRSGEASGTGDTTQPYEWVCLGRHGGTSDSCSAPTARIEADEIFSGQDALEEKIKAAGPLKGKLVVMDSSFGTDDPRHAERMRRHILDIGVPEENVTLVNIDWNFFGGNRWQEVRQDTLVVSHPTTWASHEFGERGGRGIPSYIRRLNILHVAAVGNTNTFGNRDLWYPNHANWKRFPGGYEKALAAFATNKVILATYARLDSEGNVVPNPETVRCGNAKNSCFAVLLPPDGRHQNSSDASARLGALTFYLAQLWNTPQKIVRVLNACAEDVGEPGIDEEFGRGVASVVCETVRNREVGLVAQSTLVSSASPVLNQMTAMPATVSLPRSLVSQSLTMPTRLRFFHAINGYNLETITGYVGSRLSLGGTDLFIASGADRTPLGIHSSLLPEARIPFMELGTKRILLSHGRHRVAVLGVYGYGEGNSMSAHVGHVGARYEGGFASGSLSLDVGYRRTQGYIGIPGYREAGASPAPFRSSTPEVRFLFSLRR